MFENIQIPRELAPSDPRFGVGPSLVPVEHLKRLAETGTELLGTSHRQAAVIEVVKRVRDGVVKYFEIPKDYEVLIGNGGATFLFDMIGLGLVEQSSVHFTCGEFSQKWYKSHAKIPWITAKEISIDYGQGIDPSYQPGFDTLCCTLNETSTGVRLTSLPKDVGAETIVCVDATSGAGQMPIDMSQVDFYFFSPQKVFAAEGGMYVAIASPKAIARAQKIAASNRYIPEIMNFNHHIENSKKDQTYNTPSISNLFLLAEQVELMNELGRQEVDRLTQLKSDLIYSWAQNHPKLNPYITDAKYRSPVVATIDVDDHYNVSTLCQFLREKKIAYDIEGYRKLGRNQLRIGMFHNISYQNLEKLTKVIDLLLA